MTTALEESEWSGAHPGRTLPLGKTRYPLYMRLGGPQGRSSVSIIYIYIYIYIYTLHVVGKKMNKLFIIINNKMYVVNSNIVIREKVVINDVIGLEELEAQSDLKF